MSKQGILLVNLGTPDSPSTANVRKYLDEFLMDERVIDINPVTRALLVKGIIVPFRSPKSAKLYREIWSDTTGSPLMHYSLLQRDHLQQRLGDDYHVELAMRYQSPSIESALNKLKDAQVSSIRVIPMFPHYASASTGSVLEKVMELVNQGKVKLVTNAQAVDLIGDARLKKVVLEIDDQDNQEVDVDYFIPLFGLSPKLGPLADWGLEIDQNAIVVNTFDYSTNLPGVYAIGDVNTYPGKLKLILCGFHEGTLMVQSAFRYIYPDQKLSFKYTTVAGVNPF